MPKKQLKWTYENVKTTIEGPEGNGCTLLTKEEDYVSSTTLLSVECRCGNEFKTKIPNFCAKKNPKKQCNQCSNHTIWSFDEVKKFIEQDSQSGCILISNKYLNLRERMDFICKCENPFSTTFELFRDHNSQRCSDCTAKLKGSIFRTPIEEVRYFIEVESGSGCKWIGGMYKRIDSLLEIQCKCGEAFNTTLKSFKYDNVFPKQQCDKCSGRSWKTEEVVEEYLKKYKFDYRKQYKFEDCRNERVLPFDFAIFKKGELKCLIECDGEQHEKAVSNWGGEEGFAKRKRNDQIKNEYCHKSNIKLIRISYSEYRDIDYILDQYLRRNRGEIRCHYQLRLAL